MKHVDHAGQDSAAVASIRALGALVTQISRPWAALMVVAAVASTLHLNVSEKHDLSGSVAVSALTVALLALIWLPSLLRVLGVAGGGVKTPAGEAATPGLARLFDPIDPQTKRETFPVLLTALTSPGVLADSEERTQSEALRRDLELQLAAVMPVVGGNPRDAGSLRAGIRRDPSEHGAQPRADAADDVADSGSAGRSHVVDRR